MGLVLTLIAGDGKVPLTRPDVDTACSAIERGGGSPGTPDWLSAGEACDIPFEGRAETALANTRAALRGRPLDVNVIAAAGRRKRLLLADMDSTVIGQECIDELAAEIGVAAEVSAITEQAMRGEIAFEPALRARVALLSGLSPGVIGRLLESRIALTPGAQTLVRTMRKAGAYSALVSGGFSAFTCPIAKRVGFDEHHANKLLVDGGAFTGALAEPIFGAEGKAEMLRRLAARLELEPADALAVGDGANDLPMVRLAGLGVAFRAKPALRAEANAWIDHADLTGLLFLQGFRRDEFVRPG